MVKTKSSVSVVLPLILTIRGQRVILDSDLGHAVRRIDDSSQPASPTQPTPVSSGLCVRSHARGIRRDAVAICNSIPEEEKLEKAADRFY
jgi:hypothetical protein